MRALCVLLCSTQAILLHLALTPSLTLSVYWRARRRRSSSSPHATTTPALALTLALALSPSLALALALAPEQAILILAARHHYSVDVVVALYTVPLLWSWWGHAFPHDLAPDDARIAAFVLGRDRERQRERLNGANHSHTSHSLSPELSEHVTNHVL